MKLLIQQHLIMLLLQRPLPERLPLLISAHCLPAPSLPQPGLASQCLPPKLQPLFGRQETGREHLPNECRRLKARAGFQMALRDS